MTKIILVGGEKGGTGKTTIATNLAAMRAKEGRDVLLVDTDLQGSASDWACARDEAGITPRVACVQKFGKGLPGEITDLAKRYQDIIIDAGGRDSLELRSALTVAEIVVVPVQASQFDLWTLNRVDELVAQAQTFNNKLKPLILISRASTHHNSADAGMAADLVNDYENFTLSLATIRDRKVYRQAAASGRGVIECKPENELAAKEISDLYKEVFGS